MLTYSVTIVTGGAETLIPYRWISANALSHGASVGAVHLSLHSIPRFGFNSVSDRGMWMPLGLGPTFTYPESALAIRQHRHSLWAVATLSQNDSRSLVSWLALQFGGGSRAGLCTMLGLAIPRRTKRSLGVGRWVTAS
jgi:hypothetical protein